MSLFPFNYNKHYGYGNQGSPLDYPEASKLSDKIFRWHSDNETSDWTQQSDNAFADIRHIALGMVTMLAEPSFVKMLISVGERTEHFVRPGSMEHKQPSTEWLKQFTEDLQRYG